MRLLIQRVSRAAVSVDQTVVGEIAHGLIVLVGITHDDSSATLARMADKLVKLRIFSDAEGKMNKSVIDVNGSVLAVSQFTLYADASSGNRPSYTAASRPEHAAPAFDEFVSMLSTRLGKPVPTGVFGADMRVELINDGPVTIWLDSHQLTQG